MTTLNKKTKQNINVLKTLQRVLQMRDRRHVAENTNERFHLSRGRKLLVILEIKDSCIIEHIMVKNIQITM